MARGWIHTVHRSDSSDWANKVEGEDGPASVHPTKDAAVARGREMAIAAQTEHVIHNMDGTISERNSYGNDPHPPAG